MADEAVIKIILQDAGKSGGGGGGSAGGSGGGGGGRSKEDEIDRILKKLQELDDAEVAEVARRNKKQGQGIASEMDALARSELGGAKNRAKEIAQEQAAQAAEDNRRLRDMAEAHKAEVARQDPGMSFGPHKEELVAGAKRKIEEAKEYAREVDVLRKGEDNWIKDLMRADKERVKEQKNEAKEYAEQVDVLRKHEDDWIKELMKADNERAKAQKAQANEYAELVDILRKGEDNWIKELMRGDKERAKAQKEEAKEYGKQVAVIRKGEDDYVKELMKGDKEREKARREAESRDPFFQAEKRREGQRKGALADDAYKQMYGDPGKDTAIDSVLKVVDGLRGTIGGIFGVMTGAVVDIVSAVRRQQKEGEREGLREQLLAEAKGATRGGRPARGTGVPGGGPPGSGAGAEAAEGGEAAGGAAEVAEGGAASGAAAAAVAVAAVVAAVTVIKALIGEANKMADRYGEYNPQIAQAQAMAEIRNTLGDLRRAQEIAPEMVEFIRVQSELSQSWEDFKVQFMKLVLPTLTLMLEGIKNILSLMPGVNGTFDDITDPAEALMNDLRFNTDTESTVGGAGPRTGAGFVPRL